MAHHFSRSKTAASSDHSHRLEEVFGLSRLEDKPGRPIFNRPEHGLLVFGSAHHEYSDALIHAQCLQSFLREQVIVEKKDVWLKILYPSQCLFRRPRFTNPRETRALKAMLQAVPIENVIIGNHDA